jgi:hypothetical protein
MLVAGLPGRAGPPQFEELVPTSRPGAMAPVESAGGRLPAIARRLVFLARIIPEIRRFAL